MPNIQTTDLDHEGGGVPALTRVTVPILEGVGNGLMKTLSITARDATTLNGFYLTEIDDSGTETIFCRARFWVNFKINLNDFPISSNNTYTVSFENYVGGVVGFTSSLSYIEIQ